ncbi:MAG TPA: rhodanese-like domain-containing protein [Anaerolineae bacterium]
MFIKPFVDEGLGNSSYLVGSEETGLAAVIDPQRDGDQYVQVADGLGFRLKYALDTHLHADFISGVRELAAQVDLQIGASAEAELGFDHLPLRDGDTLALGELTVAVLATPGHSPEHIGFTVTEPKRTSPAAIFTGGALIVGGAARTDLLGHDLTVPLARQLYHTFHHKLLALPDSVSVYPTHGAGSFCIAPTSLDRVTTIGRERATNRLAQARSEEEFVALALDGLPSYPVYFKELRAVNRRGPKVLGGLPELKPLSPVAVHEWLGQGGAVLDVRPAREFAEGHVPNAYGIALDTPLITWAGWLIPFGAPLVLVANSRADCDEAVRQLIRIGYDDLRGYLEGGIAAWEAADLPVTRIRRIPVAELRDRLNSGDAPLVLDVRQDDEWTAGHIPGAIHIEDGRLPYEDLPLPADRPIVVHCQHRDRSTAGLAVLARRGYRDLTLLDGGFAAWHDAGFEVEQGLR